jgi:hypothetical protein
VAVEAIEPKLVSLDANAAPAPTKSTASVELAGGAEEATTAKPEALEPWAESVACGVMVMVVMVCGVVWQSWWLSSCHSCSHHHHILMATSPSCHWGMATGLQKRKEEVSRKKEKRKCTQRE